MKNKITYLCIINLILSLTVIGCSKNEKSTTENAHEYNSSMHNKAEANSNKYYGELIIAARDGKYRTAEELIRKGANINEYTGTELNQITPLIAALLNFNPDIAKLLIREGAQVHQKYEGYSAKDYAFYYGYYDVVDSIINKNKLGSNQ